MRHRGKLVVLPQQLIRQILSLQERNLVIPEGHLVSEG